MALTDTTRKMASIQKISSLSPIENSDFLEVAMMENLGWKVVVKKGEFRIGQHVVYLEIDSAINVNDLIEPLKFLADKGTRKLFTGRTPETSAFSEEYVRIKTIKLRGQVSQGLIIPLDSVIASIPIDRIKGEDGSVKTMTFDLGDDYTQLLKIEVWDRLVEWFEDNSQLGPRAHGNASGTFPSDVPKTDETRIQTCYFDLIKDPKNVEADWEVTEKNDGSSCTLFYRPQFWNTESGKEPMQIASRRFLLKGDGTEANTESRDWFDAFRRIGWDILKALLNDMWNTGLYHLGENGDELVFPSHHEIAIQGEMVGPRFNNNRDKNTETHFRVFRIFDITDQKFVSPKNRYYICKYLGLEHVKVIETCKAFDKFKCIDDFVAYAVGKTDHGLPREGVVFKRVDNGFVSFKAINNEYLLKEK